MPKPVLCPQKFCREWNKKVYEYDNGEKHCEGCGATYTGVRWVYRCQMCGDESGDKLYGLFIPHSCKQCHTEETEKNRKAGNICRNGHTFNNCYC